jgi:hypothetical protein
MQQLKIFLAITLLAGCTSMNRYVGSDAASMPVPCDAPTFLSPDGKTYKPYVSLVEIDSAYTGSGHGCVSPYVYSLKPGMRRIKVVANFDSLANTQIFYGIHEFQVEIKPNRAYRLSSTFDGSVIVSKISEQDTGAVAGEGSTADLKTSSKSNAALRVLPLLVK